MAEPNLLDKRIITEILSEIDTGEERDRKRQAFDAFQVFSGNLKPYVETELKRTRPISHGAYSVSTVSVSQIVVDKLAKSYNVEPIRGIVDSAGKSSETKTESLMSIYTEGQATRQLKELDQIVNLHKHGLLWINWRQEEEMWQFVALAPYEFSVVRNKDTGRVEIVILKYPDTSVTSNAKSATGNNLRRGGASGDGRANFIAESQVDSGGQTQVFAMWSAENHVVVKLQDDVITLDDGTTEVKRSITYVPIPDNPNNINPLGLIPFIYVTKDNSPDFPTINPITDQTITLNALWSEHLTSANIQGTSIFTLSYPESQQGIFETIGSGLTTGIELPQKEDQDIETKANFITPSPDLNGASDAYNGNLRRVLAQHLGASGTSGLDGAGVDMHPSALDRIVANADVQGLIAQNQMCLYGPMEIDIFKVIKAWNKNVLNNSAFSEEDDIITKYPKPKILISDKETLENIEKRLDMGLMEPWEALIVMDPNMSEAQAREKIDAIAASRMKIFGNTETPNNKDDKVEPEGNTEQK